MVVVVVVVYAASTAVGGLKLLLFAIVLVHETIAKIPLLHRFSREHSFARSFTHSLVPTSLYIYT